MENYNPEKDKRSRFLKYLMGGKIYLINPYFQGRFMIQVAAVVIICLGVIYLANAYFFHTLVEKGIALELPKDHVYFMLLDEQQSLMNTIFLSVAAILAVVLGLWGLFFSHRIAGPIYRITKTLDAAKDANIEPIRIRKKDFFQEIPESINQFVKNVRDQ